MQIDNATFVLNVTVIVVAVASVVIVVVLVSVVVVIVAVSEVDVGVVVSVVVAVVVVSAIAPDRITNSRKCLDAVEFRLVLILTGNKAQYVVGH